MLLGIFGLLEHIRVGVLGLLFPPDFLEVLYRSLFTYLGAVVPRRLFPLGEACGENCLEVTNKSFRDLRTGRYFGGGEGISGRFHRADLHKHLVNGVP